MCWGVKKLGSEKKEADDVEKGEVRVIPRGNREKEKVDVEGRGEEEVCGFGVKFEVSSGKRLKMEKFLER